MSLPPPHTSTGSRFLVIVIPQSSSNWCHVPGRAFMETTTEFSGFHLKENSGDRLCPRSAGVNDQSPPRSFHKCTQWFSACHSSAVPSPAAFVPGVSRLQSWHHFPSPNELPQQIREALLVENNRKNTSCSWWIQMSLTVCLMGSFRSDHSAHFILWRNRSLYLRTPLCSCRTVRMISDFWPKMENSLNPQQSSCDPSGRCKVSPTFADHILSSRKARRALVNGL